MTGLLVHMMVNLLLAWGAGAVVGFERSFNGRAAGFRTHSLVALAAASVVLISYLPAVSHGYSSPSRLDPTRLSQGVMTGLGFLGAGVIFKEGVSVQGLTTAAAIWCTAAVGMLFGLGMYIEGAAALGGVMLTLTAMRWIEGVFPWRVYAMITLRYQTGRAPSESELEKTMRDHEVDLEDVSYRLIEGGEMFEFRGNIETRRKHALRNLAEHLKSVPGLVEYDLARISK
jgi:putative Mg2+ transporter-C (MgtC) family protein